MAYSENTGQGGLAGHDPKFLIPILVFMSISLYNVLELNVLILATFKKRQGLYFWSFLAATNGIAPHTIGFLLKNIVFLDNFILNITLVSVGWVMMVTGQSLVLYSRLHLVFWNRFYLKLVLAMIITNAIILHGPIIILMYGSNSSTSNPFIHPYMVYEKIQVTMFFLQELIISAIYIKTCSSFFEIQGTLHGNGGQKMRRHLLLVNVIIILLDIPILGLEYADFYDTQTAYKALVYSVKLKLEFNILNKLVEMTHGHDASGSHSQGGRGTDTGGTAIHMSTFNGEEGGNRTFIHGGDQGGTTQRGKLGKRTPDTGIMRSTEISVHCIERSDEDSESLERKSIGTGESHYRSAKGMGGLSKSSSEINLATRGF
ncbi:Fc.00g074030.m01.CDS01 [Cosmosporella sp. VM-42]